MSTELTPLQRAFLALEDARGRLAAIEHRQREPIAIVGLGCRFPGSATNPREYWKLLSESRSAITTVPTNRWDHAPFFDATSTRPGTTYAQHAGFISEPVEGFDAAFFGISPREAAGMDPQQRLLLEVAWEALENASIAPDRLAGSSTGVFVGMPSADYQQLQLRGGTLSDIDAHYASGIAHSIASGRLSYLLGLHGPSISLDTACSSSLVAVHLACQNLRAGECDMALAAGVNLILTPESFVAFGRTQMLAADGRCKPFDISADGFVRGEGCGVVVLRRLSSAQADGDRVLAVIRGSAVNQDGASASLTAPSGPAQEAVIRRALKQSVLTPGDVHVVEAHGTGTPLGDPIELRALGAVYGAARNANNALVVGSVKANIGHLEGAAGVASLIKAVLMLEAARVPSQLYIDTPTPHVDWPSLHLRLPTAGGEAWPGDGTRRAAVSSFGFSGTNAHLIVEQAPAQALDARPPRPIHVIPIAGKSASAVRELASSFGAMLASGSALGDLAHSLAVGRAQLLGARCAVVASDNAAASVELSAIATGAQITEHSAGVTPRAAFLFTGQGSQYPDMARELYDTLPVFTESIDAASVVLFEVWGGVTLTEVLYGPDSAMLLADARYVQPAIVAVELALAASWRAWGVEPVMVAGHSLGEYAAAVVAGVMSSADALRLVAKRGTLMAQLPAVEFVMTSVPAGVAAVRAVLGNTLGTDVELAADNGPTQCVLTGLTDAIAIAEARIRTALSVEPKRLVATTNAFHSRHIEPMLDAFERAAAAVTFSAPRIPVCWNLGRAALEPHQAPTASYWRQQTRGTVQFGEVISALRDRGVTQVIEVGPHPVLTGLVAAVDDPTLPRGIASLRRGRGAWETLAQAVAQWWVAGGLIDWMAFDAPYAFRKIALPTYPFAREKHWLAFARVGAQPQRVHDGHALVGTRLSSPALRDIVFERELSARALPLLDQHRIHGNAILPGAAWLDAMATAGAVAYAGTRWAVCGLTLHAPLHVPDDRPRVVQLVLSRNTDGVPQVSSHSREAGDVEGEWLLHAQATLEPIRATPPAAPVPWPDADETACRTFYERFAAVGLSLGPQFQLVRAITRGNGHATAIVTASDTPEWPHGVVHPALIDACIQAIALVVPPAVADEDTLYMPLAVERFEWFGETGEVFACEASLRANAIANATNTESIVADVRVTDRTGAVIGQLHGVTLKRATASALRLVTRDAVRDALYEMVWDIQPLQPADSVRPPLSQITQRVEEQGPVHAAATSLNRYAVDGPAMERLAALYVWRALQQLGADLTSSAPFTAAALAAQLGVLPRHGQFFARLLDILVEDAVLRRDADAYVVVGSLDTTAISAAVNALKARNTPFDGELNLLVRCGEQLGPGLTGAIDALALLFPDGSLDQVHRIYRDSPFPRTYNALVRDAVGSLIASRTGAQPLRVLEVGGGTGGTTAAVLEAIPDGASTYVFTDTSPLFLSRARDRFARRNGVSFTLFDLEKSASMQGFEAGAFDLIVAANVIHATRDVAATLASLKTLLAPDGVLLMLEVSRPSRWVDLSFGFTDGWWAFDDAFRSTYPLLNADGWQRALNSVGFDDIAIALGAMGSGEGLEEQFMVIARSAPRPLAVQVGTWVVISSPDGFGASVVNELDVRGRKSVLVSPTAAGDALREELQQTLSNVSGDVAGIVNCLALDARLDAAPDAAAARIAVSTLAVAQAMLTSHRSTSSAAPRLWNVTRGSIRVDTADAAPDLAGSPVWGIVRTLQLEHPELQASCIDLCASAALSDAERISDELTTGLREQQVALRDSSRFVARINHAKRAPVMYPRSYRVAPRERGTIDALELTGAEVPVPAANEVVIHVAATGLNFKDVLNVLGTYPGDAGAIGGECAGYVLSVGSDVRTLSIGDRVVALASGAMSSHVTADASLVAAVPAECTLDDAASLPIAYLTAHHTLIERGKLQRGERVLIHAGAGGVGLAAIRLAQRVGAEIFATAGSESKRTFLRELGVQHVFDSRSTAFADEILEVTGGAGVHVTLNSLADAFVERSLAATAHGGRFLEIGKRGIWPHEQVAALQKDIDYHIVDWTGLARSDPERIGVALRELLHDVARGELPSLPTTVFPMSRMHYAFRYMAQGRHTGKIVISHREALDADGAGAVAIIPGAAYIIIGGTSGLGLRTAQWMADRGATHLVLCSRSGAGDETARTVAPLAASGVRVDVESVDVADSAALGAVLNRIRETATIRGVIQSAGALDDGAVLQLDTARVERVFAAKVHGTWNLHTLTRNDPLDFFVCYASVAGFLGSPGQANHAAANTFIDALAHHRRAEGRPAVSIDWGAWDEIGAAVRHDVLTRAAGLGVRSISPESGLAILTDVFDGAPAQVAAVPIDWPAFFAARSGRLSTVFDRIAQQSAARTSSANTTTAVAATSRAVAPAENLVVELANAVPARRASMMRNQLRTRVARTLGLSAGQSVDDRQPLRDAGLDSLLAIELRNVIGTAIGRTLPATLLFDYPTIDDLATHLLAQLFPVADGESANTVAALPTESSASLVDDLSTMSDDDVDRLFAERMKGR